MKHAAATLGSGNLRNAVALPDGEDLNEWVAVNSKSPLTTTTSHHFLHETMFYKILNPFSIALCSR